MEGRKKPISFSEQINNPWGVSALSLLPSQLFPRILERQTLPHLSLSGVLGFLSFLLFNGHILLPMQLEVVNLKQVDYVVRKGRTGMVVLRSWSWSFPIHWSPHRYSPGDDSWNEGHRGILQIAQGVCRMVLYSFDKAFLCFYSSPCHL